MHLPTDEYEKLLRDSKWLSCLEDAGVGKWKGIDYAYWLHRERQNNLQKKAKESKKQKK